MRNNSKKIDTKSVDKSKQADDEPTDLKAAKEEIDVLKQSVADMSKRRKEDSNKIQELEKKIKEQDKQIEERDKRIVEQDKRIKEQGNQLEDQDLKIEQLMKKTRRLTRENKNLMNDIAKKDKEIDDLKIEFGKLRESNENLQKTITQILNVQKATSWTDLVEKTEDWLKSPDSHPHIGRALCARSSPDNSPLYHTGKRSPPSAQQKKRIKSSTNQAEPIAKIMKVLPSKDQCPDLFNPDAFSKYVSSSRLNQHTITNADPLPNPDYSECYLNRSIEMMKLDDNAPTANGNQNNN